MDWIPNERNLLSHIIGLYKDISLIKSQVL